MSMSPCLRPKASPGAQSCLKARRPNHSYGVYNYDLIDVARAISVAMVKPLASLVPRRSGRGEERTPGIYCLRMRAFSEISRKMGYSRNLLCNDYVEIPLHRIFARTSETAYGKWNAYTKVLRRLRAQRWQLCTSCVSYAITNYKGRTIYD